MSNDRVYKGFVACFCVCFGLVFFFLFLLLLAWLLSCVLFEFFWFILGLCPPFSFLLLL